MPSPTLPNRISNFGRPSHTNEAFESEEIPGPSVPNYNEFRDMAGTSTSNYDYDNNAECRINIENFKMENQKETNNSSECKTYNRFYISKTQNNEMEAINRNIVQPCVNLDSIDDNCILKPM